MARTPMEQDELDRRLVGMSWGLFLIMVGGFALVPSTQLPQGIWLVGIGLIMLGINAVRVMLGLRLGWVTTILGAIALAAGLGDMSGIDVPVGPILIILVGLAIILRSLDRSRSGGDSGTDPHPR